PSGSPVDFEDALDVGLHRCPRERAARFRLHLGVELLVLETLVALERHPIDDGGFNDRDDDLAAGAPDLHVLEQAGVDEGLVGAVDLEVGEALARPEPEVRLDRAGLDPTIALDDDLLGGGAAGGGRGEHDRAQGNAAENKDGHAYSAKYARPELHARPILSLSPPAIRQPPGAADLLFLMIFTPGGNHIRPPVTHLLSKRCP